MALINRAGQEISAKVVYYGPGLSGKTTNLELLFKQVPEHHRGKMISMKTRTDRTLFFDLLPFNAEPIMDHQVRILLYTVPGQVYYNATRRLVLKGVDAIVFVADSQRSKLQENLESLENLRANLADMALKLEDLPWVIQYNKRDLHDILSIPELEQALNPRGIPHFTAVAPRGEGVHTTLRGVIQHLEPSLRKLVKQDSAMATETAAQPDLEQQSWSGAPSLDPPRPAPSRVSPAGDHESLHPDAPAVLPTPPAWRHSSQPSEPVLSPSPARLAAPPLGGPPSAPPSAAVPDIAPQFQASPSTVAPPTLPNSGPIVNHVRPQERTGETQPGLPVQQPQASPDSAGGRAGDEIAGTDAGAPDVSVDGNRSADDSGPPELTGREAFDLGPLNLDSLPDPLVVELPIRGHHAGEDMRDRRPRVSPESRQSAGRQEPQAGARRDAQGVAQSHPAAGSPAGGEFIVQVPRHLLEQGELRLRLVLAPERSSVQARRQEELLGQD